MTFVANTDVVAEMFSFLNVVGRKALRNVCRNTVRAFNHAVQLGFARSEIATYGPPDTRSGDCNVSWFPATRLAQGGKLKVTITANAEHSGTALCRVSICSDTRDAVLFLTVKTEESINSISTAFPQIDAGAITALELNGLPEVDVIGSAFLSGCSSVCELSLINLPKVRAVVQRFAPNSPTLQVVELSGFDRAASHR